MKVGKRCACPGCLNFVLVICETEFCGQRCREGECDHVTDEDDLDLRMAQYDGASHD